MSLTQIKLNNKVKVIYNWETEMKSVLLTMSYKINDIFKTTIKQGVFQKKKIQTRDIV